MKAGQIKRRLTNFRDDESGAIAVVVVVLLVVLLGMGALAIDLGHMCWVQTDLKKAAEAGALAGARGLWPADLSSGSDRTGYPKWDQAEGLAKVAAARNKVEGINLNPDASEVTAQAGIWNYAAKSFTPDHSSNANGIQVTTHRNNVKMILAQIFGIFSKNMSATATAIMDSGVIFIGSLPIAVNKRVVNTEEPGSLLYPNPANSDNMGWFALSADNSANASTLDSYIPYPGNDKYQQFPPVSIDNTIYINNGEISKLLGSLDNLLNAQANGYLDCILPVIDTDSFNHPTQIIGFASVRITKIVATGNDKHIEGKVIPYFGSSNLLPGGGGGGGGALSTPRLVQ